MEVIKDMFTGCLLGGVILAMILAGLFCVGYTKTKKDVSFGVGDYKIEFVEQRNFEDALLDVVDYYEDILYDFVNDL